VTDILPDCRAKDTGKTIKYKGLNWCPVFCANCGKHAGYVPEENMTFAFYLCEHPCAEKWGATAHTYTEPDVAFWKRVHEESQERYGRILTGPEFKKVVDEGTTPLAKLIREGTS
jgi:hypothetical protein